MARHPSPSKARLAGQLAFGLALGLCSSLIGIVTAAQGSATVQPPRRSSLDGEWTLRVLEVTSGRHAVGTAMRVRVPADFESALGSDFDGVVAYERDFEVSRHGRQYLVFAAAMTHAEVFVNDKRVGSHRGGWTPFSFEISSAVDRAKKKQRLRVVVDEGVGHDTQGFLPAIQPHFGGLWQSVTLVETEGAAFDRLRTALVPKLVKGRASLVVHARFREAGAQSLRVRLWRGKKLRFDRQVELPAEQLRFDQELRVTEGVDPWGPGKAAVYSAELQVLDSEGRVLDLWREDLAFRELEVRGRRILLNGKDLIVRGILHWGYEPPTLAPRRSREAWRKQFAYAKALGFNLMKACLWLPPKEFYEAALQEGMLVWNEYPAWHPDFSEKKLPALLQEYEEFFHYDRALAPVIIRSLTCETGHASAADKTVKALYERCKEITGGVLIEDDSSWITWNRYSDFYDDHPYGNCDSWLSRLDGFDRYMKKHGAKPLLLGEAITSDTWARLGSLTFALGMARDPWWKPLGFEAQATFQDELCALYGTGTVRRLIRESQAYALQQRKYQIETFRGRLPHAGYVSSVFRDFRKARMGFVDERGGRKWRNRDWDWHRETIFVLEDARAIRSLDMSGRWPPKSLRLGAGGDAFVDSWQERPTKLERPERIECNRSQGNVRGSHAKEPLAFRNSWAFWLCPRRSAEVPDGVRVSTGIDVPTLDWVRAGGRLLLLAGGKGSLKSQEHWFLRGAPYGPVEHELFERVPRRFLMELQCFDLSGPLFPSTELSKHFDPILAFWDTHDLDRVDRFQFLSEAKVGKGRIVACALGLSLAKERPFDAPSDSKDLRPNPARAYLRAELLSYLAEGKEPKKRVPEELVAKWRDGLSAKRLPLDGSWLLHADKEDRGTKSGWMKPGFDDRAWIHSRAGIHWEHAGLPHYTGVAWYRKHFDMPKGWKLTAPVYAVFEGVDDSYVLYVNGKRIASFGDPKTGETVWLIQTHAEISKALVPGKNLIALRVVDHAGAGGLHRPVYLSTADPRLDDCLQR